MKKLCIYHANCADGFTAAWVVRRYFGDDIEFHPGVYGEFPPDVRGRDVIVVDFSYPRDVMLNMIRQGGARGILVLDHHKTAMDALIEAPDATGHIINFTEKWITLQEGITWDRYRANVDAYDVAEGAGPRIYTYFDLERSGAGITWDFFYPGQPRPDLVNYVEDRDLWKFTLPHTREKMAAAFSFEYTFDNWDKLNRLDDDALVVAGTAIERKHFKDINEILAVCSRMMYIGGYTVPVVNIPYTMGSDAGAILAKGKPFAAYYYDTPQHRVFGLRSDENGLDVSLIAKEYGGGGHKHAAGFRVDRFHPFAKV